MKYFPISIIIFLLAFACQSDRKTVQKKNEEERLLEEYSVDVKTGKREGTFRSFFPNGQIFEESYYVNDSLHGERRMYYEDGTLNILEHHVAGRFHGPYQMFYENGQLALEGDYENNVMRGQWKRFYKTGELMEVVHYENNLENGPFVEYYRNGNKKAEGHYLDGDNEHGELLMYDESGELVRKMDCRRGICKTIWKRS